MMFLLKLISLTPYQGFANVQQRAGCIPAKRWWHENGTLLRLKLLLASPKTCLHKRFIGCRYSGWWLNHPSEKCARQNCIKSSPIFGMKIKNV